MSDKIIIVSTPSRKTSEHYRRFVDFMRTADRPAFTGVDWAKDSGMNRGDVIGRDDNITHVRFKTVGIERDPNHKEN